MPEEQKELEHLKGMGQEGVLVTLINIRHDISDVRGDLKEVNKELNRARDFEAKTSGQFGVLKGVGGALGAVIMGVLGWAMSQIWAHSVAIESLPDFKARVVAVQEEQTRQNGSEVSNSTRIDKLENQEAARHK